jgi:dTDP-4-dehydrorhamnose reductase
MWEAEQRVRAASPLARVVRLGWQIGDAPGSNNMVDFLAARQAEDGAIGASRRWYPACSFLADTAAALERAAALPPDLYLCDANRRWTFLEIVTALNVRHGGRWQVVTDDAFVYDQRMVDPRLDVPSLQSRLPTLP